MQYRKKFLALAVTLAGTMIGGASLAKTITFDDAIVLGSAAYSYMPSGYAGLTWDNFGVSNVPNMSIQQSGYHNGVVSGTYVAFNWEGGPAAFASSAGFNLEDAQFTAAWNNNLQIDAVGYVNNEVRYSKTFFVSTTGPTLVEFDWTGVTKVSLFSGGGTDVGFGGSGPHFALDNLNVSSVPEVSSTALFLVAAPLVGAALRRKRNTIAG